MPTRPLAVMFALLVFYAATQMLLDLKPRSTRELPGSAGIFAAGAAIGAVSSLAAVGGAVMSIPFLTWCKGPLRRAIGTAAANGLPIALAGTAGYVLHGLRASGPPQPSLRFGSPPARPLRRATR